MREKRCSSTVNIIIIAACFLLIGIFRTEAVFCVSEYTDESTQITFTYNIVNGCAVITGMNRETLPEDGTLTIPAEISGKAVRVLGTSAFSNDKDIKKLIVPGSVQRIDHYCFNGCSGITDIELNEGLTELGEMAFRSCAFKTIELPSSVTTIGQGCFSMCKSLQFMKIPSGVTSVPEQMLQYCSSLEYIEIPAGVTGIGNAAFEQCTALHAVYVNSENKNYISVDGVLFTADRKTLMVYPCAKKGDSYAVPGGVVSIAPHAFHGAVQLCSVSIPESVSSLGDYSFCNCEKLSRVSLSGGLKNIGDSAFSQCESLEGIAIPESVKVIGQTAFFASGLKSVTIPSSVSEIKSMTFCACKSLGSAVISDGVLKIGSGAFQSCGVLRYVVVPDSVTDVGQYAFADAGNSLEDEKNFVLVCSADSAAAAYAADNGIQTAVSVPEEPDAAGTEDQGEAGSDDTPADINEDGKNTDKKDNTTDGQPKANKDNTNSVQPETNKNNTKAVQSKTKKDKRLSAPRLKIRNKSGQSVKITWSRVKGAAGYEIYIKCPGQKKFHRRAVRNSRVKSVTHRNLLRNRRYYYKVRAFRKAGKKKIYGKWSKVRSVKIKR